MQVTVPLPAPPPASFFLSQLSPSSMKGGSVTPPMQAPGKGRHSLAPVYLRHLQQLLPWTGGTWVSPPSLSPPLPSPTWIRGITNHFQTHLLAPYRKGRQAVLNKDTSILVLGLLWCTGHLRAGGWGNGFFISLLIQLCVHPSDFRPLSHILVPILSSCLLPGCKTG